MEEYFIEVSLHSVVRYKVLAEDVSQAMEVAQAAFVEDWEIAGPLQYSDLNLDDWDPDNEPPSKSLIAAGPTWHLAPDDPDYEDEEEDEASVPAGD